MDRDPPVGDVFVHKGCGKWPRQLRQNGEVLRGTQGDAVQESAYNAYMKGRQRRSAILMLGR